MNRVLTMIMAGGAGTRLSVLSNRRAKPAVPFCGIYRIIDFALSNAMHSGVRQLGIVTQYRPYSLADHFGLGEWWGLSGFGRTGKIRSPHTGNREASFYTNSADAVFHNIEFIQRFPNCTEVIILSGDHIYQMDYRPMLHLHRDKGATLTLATQEVPWEETSRFGIMVCNKENRITRFQEKPKQNPLSNKASLGIYVFNRDALIQILKRDQDDPDSSHDFGNDIIPSLIQSEPVFNYDFRGYWRDVGTVKSYMDTSMEALDPTSGFDLEAWGVRTNHREIPLNNQFATRVAPGASINHSLLSKGSLIEGHVRDSIISPGVHIGPGTVVRNSIVLHGVEIENDCVIDHAIIDKNCHIGRGVQIGQPELGSQANKDYPHLLDTGITVLGKSTHLWPNVRLGRNCLVFPDVHVGTEGAGAWAAGSTFLPMEEIG